MLPKIREPMAATQIAQPFHRPGWVYEETSMCSKSGPSVPQPNNRLERTGSTPAAQPERSPHKLLEC